MSNLVRVAFAAAVVGAIALAWVNFGPQQGGVGAPPTPSPSPIQSAAPPATMQTGSAAPGTYVFPGGGIGSDVAFTLPAGWAADDSMLITKHAGAPNEVMFTMWQVTHVYPDACQHEDSTVVSAGTSTAQLANLLAAQKSQTASAITDVTVDGLPAKHLELTVPAGLDLATCTNGMFRMWPDPGPNFGGGYCCFPAGSVNDLSIVDVGGQRVVFIARHQPGSSAADKAELQRIIDSLAINLPPASASPSGASATP